MVLSESPNKKDTVRISWEAATKTVIEKVVKLRLESDYGKNYIKLILQMFRDRSTIHILKTIIYYLFLNNKIKLA